MILRDDVSPNALRYRGRGGHVESYFLRANDPRSARALWLKATVYARVSGDAVVESWFIYFDGNRSAPFAGRASGPLLPSAFTESKKGVRISACGLRLDLAAEGGAHGEVATKGGVGRIDLTWTAAPSPVAGPLSLLRPSVLLRGPFPRSKLLTPFPFLVFNGTIDVAGERITVSGWNGMQGHNWGREHAFEYAWGQCLFPKTDVEPDSMVEGFSARVRVAGRLTPRVSCLVVRRGGEVYRFDRLFDLFRQEAVVASDSWRLAIHGSDGEARLEMDASDRPQACLGYKNPDGRMSYCMNTKLANVRLMVQPRRGAAFSCESEFGGALEFLRNAPDGRFPEVI